MGLKETKFSKDFLQELKLVYPDMWATKISGSATQQTGIPDYLLGIKGRLVMIEFKIQRDNRIKITPRQIKVINEIWDSGSTALIVAYDENKDKILIRQSRLDPKVAMDSKKINIDWDFDFNSFEEAIKFMENMIGDKLAYLLGG